MILIHHLKGHKKNFTVTDNTIAKDVNLSWTAKGLFQYLMTLPKDWQVVVNELVHHSVDGKAKTMSAIRELEAAGIIFRKRVRRGWRIHVFETPEQGKSTDFKSTCFKSTCFKSTENRRVLNTNNTNKELSICARAKGTWLEQFPKPFQDHPEFAKAWTEWEQDLKQRHHPMTKGAAIRQVNKCVPFTPDICVASIHEAIEKGWRTIYPKAENSPRLTADLPKPVKDIADILHLVLHKAFGKEHNQIATGLHAFYVGLHGTAGDPDTPKGLVHGHKGLARRYADYVDPSAIASRGTRPFIPPSGFIWTDFVRKLQQDVGLNLKTGRPIG